MFDQSHSLKKLSKLRNLTSKRARNEGIGKKKVKIDKEKTNKI